MDGTFTVGSLLHVLPPSGWGTHMLTLHQIIFLLPPRCPVLIILTSPLWTNQSCQFSTSCWVKVLGQEDSVDGMGPPLGRVGYDNMDSSSAKILVERGRKGITTQREN